MSIRINESPLPVVALAFLAGVGACRPDVAPDLAVLNVTVLDLARGVYVPDQSVLVVGNRVQAVRSGSPELPNTTTVVDGSARYLLPGLFDMHAHLVGVGPEPIPLDPSRYLVTGVLGLRDLGAPVDSITAFRQRSRPSTHPRAWFSGPIVDTPPRSLPHLFAEVDSDAEAQRHVGLAAEFGWAGIKVHDWMGRDTYDALAEHAARQGLPLVGHVPHAVPLDAAIAAGQRSIEHLGGLPHGVLRACSSRPPPELDDLHSSVEADRYRAVMSAAFLTPLLEGFDPARCTEVARQLATAGVWQVPTLSLWRFWAESPPAEMISGPEHRSVLQQLYRTYQQIVWLMVQAGVRIMAGTDEIPGATLHDEIQLLASSGLTPLEALRAATVNPVEFLQAGDSLGTVGVGYVADFILIDGSPLDDISNTARVSAVVLNGVFHDVVDGRLIAR